MDLPGSTAPWLAWYLFRLFSYPPLFNGIRAPIPQGASVKCHCKPNDPLARRHPHQGPSGPSGPSGPVGPSGPGTLAD